MSTIGKYNLLTFRSIQIGSGINADLFRPQERGLAIAIFSLAPLLAFALGPMIGGLLTQYTSWPWCFYFVSIACGAVQILSFPFLHETCAPVLLRRRCKRLRKRTRNVMLFTQEENTVSLSQLLRISLIRPFKMLATQPIIQVWSVYCAYLYGVLCLLIATFPAVWTDIYRESQFVGSLNYISLFLGITLAAQLGTRLGDGYYKKMCERNGQSSPEFRLPLLMIGTLLVPIGMFWYGWSAKSNIHWIMP